MLNFKTNIIMRKIHGNYDHDVIGTGNPNHPANQPEIEQEIEITPEEAELNDLYEENCRLKNNLFAIKSYLQDHREHNGIATILLNKEYLWKI